MSDPIEWEIVPDNEPDDSEETITGDEIFAAIMEGCHHKEEWRNGNATLRITQFVDGQRIGPMEMTKAEYDQLQRDLATQEQPPAVDKAKQKETTTTARKRASIHRQP